MKVSFSLESKLGAIALQKSPFRKLTINGFTVSVVKKSPKSTIFLFEYSDPNLINEIEKNPREWYKSVFSYAFPTVTYLSNLILIQTGQDGLDPKDLLLRSPEVFAENEDEEIRLKTVRRTITAKFRFSFDVSKPFSPEDLENAEFDPLALAYFTSSMRISDEIVRFELLFKVVEYYFDFQGERFDQEVSNYLTTSDCSYTPSKIKYIRELRNRCTHPNARKGRIDPHDVNHLHELQEQLETIKKLAESLLKKPPQMET